jgi:murein DD-endopeptidase MepM/ murein hydrolase activator NlpD
MIHFPKLNRIFNFSLPLFLLYGFLGVLMVVLPVFIYFVQDRSKRIVDQARLTALARENNVLKLKMKEFQGLSKQIQNDLASLKDTDIKLRVVTNLELMHPDVMGLGTGGTSNDSLVSALRKQGASSYSLAGDVDNALKRLLEEVRVQQDSYKQLEDHLNQQADLRNHTPSIWPAQGWLMSTFGYRVDPFTKQLQMHEGIDIAGPSGTPILAPADGKVFFVGPQQGYGLCFEIDHGYGISTLYAHCSFIKVNVGDMVKRGDNVGFTGSTGRSVGPHLHYEVHIAGQKTNPLNYIINEPSSID